MHSVRLVLLWQFFTSSGTSMAACGVRWAGTNKGDVLTHVCVC